MRPPGHEENALIRSALLLCCLAAAGLSACKLLHDVHFRNAYELSIRFPEGKGLDADKEMADRIVEEVRAAEAWGQWRPEAPFFMARVYLWAGMKAHARGPLLRASRAAPYAWWAKKLMEQAYPPEEEPEFKPFR